jgi:DNA-binding CsgD family transcriptional regulator
MTPSVVTRAEWPFVGRAAEIDQVRRLMLDDGCPGVVIAAPAGLGKTRMAHECLEAAGLAGLTTARATATASQRAMPLGALAHLLPTLNDSIAQDGSDLLRRAARELLLHTDGARLFLLVDDAHLLDDTSSTLLYRLAVANQAFVLMTIRSGEPAPASLITLWKDGFVDRLELAGLGDEACGELLGLALGGRVDPEVTSTLVDRCERNVLFLRELVLGALHDGTLAQVDGLWRLKEPVRPSARLIELIEARLHALEARERATLEVVGLGEPLGLAELGAVVDLGIAEQLEREGLLRCEVDGDRVVARLGHPLYGDVIRAQLPVVRARSIARALAELVESSGRRSPQDLLQIGRWRLVGGGGDPQTLLDAAVAARWSYEFDFAGRLARVAIEKGGGFEARLLSAQLTSLKGQWIEAEIALTSLNDSLDEDSEARQAEVAIARMDNFLYANRAEESLRVADEAGEILVSQQWRDEIQARRSPILVTVEGPDATIAAVAPLLQRASGRAFVWACLTGARSLSRRGRIDRAVELTELGHSAQLQLDQPIAWYPWFHLSNRCEALTEAGHLDEAERLATEQHAQALTDHSPEAQGVFACQLAKVGLARGHVGTATTLAREAVAIFRDLGRPMFLQEATHVLATAFSLSNRHQEASTLLQGIESNEGEAPMYDGVDLLHARAWCAAAEGRIAKACAYLDTAARLGEDIGDLVGALRALHAKGRLGHAREVKDRTRALSSEIDGDFAKAKLAHVEALAASDACALEDVSGMFEKLGADLLAADAGAEAASAWCRRGEPRRAAAITRQAMMLAERCGGATTLSLQTIDTGARLTTAEQETALLAAAGRSNKEIAEELTLSIRTIENRLQRVYEKLGIGSRRELAIAIGADG